MKALRRLGFALWLAFALVAGQHAAALHDLGHASEKLGHKQDSKPAPSKCAEHFACAQLGSAVGSSPFVPAFVAASAPRAPARRAFAASPPQRFAFNPRAPPQAA